MELAGTETDGCAAGEIGEGEESTADAAAVGFCGSDWIGVELSKTDAAVVGDGEGSLTSADWIDSSSGGVTDCT